MANIKNGIWETALLAHEEALKYLHEAGADSSVDHFPKARMYVVFTEHPHGSLERREFRY